MEVDGFVVEGKGVPDQLIMVNKPSSLPVGTILGPGICLHAQALTLLYATKIRYTQADGTTTIP